MRVQLISLEEREDVASDALEPFRVIYARIELIQERMSCMDICAEDIALEKGRIVSNDGVCHARKTIACKTCELN